MLFYQPGTVMCIVRRILRICVPGWSSVLPTWNTLTVKSSDISAVCTSEHVVLGTNHDISVRLFPKHCFLGTMTFPPDCSQNGHFHERNTISQHDCSQNSVFRERSTSFPPDCSQNRLFRPTRCLFRAVHEDVHSGSREAACRKCLGFRTCWLRGGVQHSVTQHFILRRVPKIRHLLSTNSLFYNRLASTPRRLLSFRSQNRSFQERTSTFLSSCFQNKAFQ